MFKSLIDVISNIGASIANFPIEKKIALIAVSALILASLVVLSLQTRKPDFEVLFSGLSTEDIGEIVTELKERKIDHKIAVGGTAILVPTKNVFDLRIQLASAGLPRGGGVGFEIFDKTTLGMTEFIQKLNLMRAVTGELTRTINSLDMVESSRIHIAAPEKSIFLQEEKKTTASVVLKLRGQITHGQVQGIVHLVASSVEGLAPEDITIVDIKGNILAGGKDESMVGQMTSTQFEYKQNIEKTLENRIKSILGGVLGIGKVSAKVSAEIDFTQTEQTEEIYDPESQVVRSEQRTEESDVGASPPGGVAGASANLPGGESSQLAPFSPPKSQKTNETINYEINKIIKRTVKPVGDIKKLSIAVVVDGSYDKESKFIPRTPQEIEQYKKIVERTVGYDESRGDQIEVQNVAFDVSKLEEERQALQKAEKMQRWVEIGRHVVSAIFIILLFVMLIKPLIAWLKRTSEGIHMTPTLKTAEEKMEAKKLAEVPKREDYRQMVQDYAKDEPTHTTELVRKWLKERR